MHHLIHSFLLFLSVLLNAVTALPLAKSLPVSSLGKRSVAGPVIAANFPDPGLIKVDNVWYAFATRTKGTTIHIQVAKSTDFSTWSVVSEDALPTLPDWVNQTSWNTWAPDIKHLVGKAITLHMYRLTVGRMTVHLSCIILPPLLRRQTAASTVLVLQLPVPLKDHTRVKPALLFVHCPKEGQSTQRASKTATVHDISFTRLTETVLVM